MRSRWPRNTVTGQKREGFRRELSENMSQHVAIVTAAGRGIGAACARDLAAKGYRVALMSRSDDSVHLASELKGLGLRGSVTIEADLKALVMRTMESYGRIDAVVNNTGDPPRADLLDLSDDQWAGGALAEGLPEA
jgi:NAD(P)-dependent dehydrogenase (short-subunit alcohol dehydrogenase family)